MLSFKRREPKKTNTAFSKQERELRLALVCYGGVSLAVYMHGVTKEILKLVRASRAFHATHDPVTRALGGYLGEGGVQHREIDSEEIYFKLLCDIGEHVELRVIVDIVAGASAGGINGIMLARALAHDLSLDPLRNLWLDLADVTELLDETGRAGLWSKFYMRPILSLIAWWEQKSDFSRIGGAAARDPEVRRKLSLFTRSKWFHPPFSGKRMSQMMLDGLEALGEPVDENSTLMPPGHMLELFVTTTDFWGHRQAITLHDPPMIQEREHRQTLKFEFLRRSSGEITTDFDKEGIPGLAFAARATSCFPGAFPPLNFAEIDQLVKDRKTTWGKREEFINSNFAAVRAVGENPEETAFIDGSVLMNKPFALAIRSVQGRAAHREVDRRLIYIDPNPDTGDQHSHKAVDELPGFFSTIKAALSDIPRNQPIRDDLEWLEEFNDRVRRLSQVVEAIKPKIVQEIGLMLSKSVRRPPTVKKLAQLRAEANERAGHQASYAYDGYARLKVLSVLRDVSDYLRNLIVSPDRWSTSSLIDAWAFRNKIRPIGNAASESQKGAVIEWISFLRGFDVRFRVRRIRFVLRRLNELYRDGDFGGTIRGRVWLNEVKARLYEHLDAFQRAANWHHSGALSAYVGMMQSDPGRAIDPDVVDQILDIASEIMDLPKLDEELEESLVYYATTCPVFNIWHDILTAYLGFPYYDVLTLPMVQWRDLDELDDIKVDRISVNDANSLRPGLAATVLKGTELANFGAFFSRAFRENDYLWGRLTGAERLIDIVVSAAPELATKKDFNVISYKKKIFKTILESEYPHLTQVSHLIAELLAETDQL